MNSGLITSIAVASLLENFLGHEHYIVVEHQDHVPTAVELCHFPLGVPAFEQHTHFDLQRDSRFEPFLFLSAQRPSPLRFICVPIAAIRPDYRYQIGADEANVLEVPPGPCALGDHGLIVLATVTVLEDGEPRANLLAPIVMNPATGTAVQSIQFNSGWSHEEPMRQKAAVECS